ncbi:MAG: HAMP domain-containing histidine kinase [Candidatus Obscuribacterales bacterium]|nr:HAMP domain-containing histidine kinase [Candidatus Obscuribacterales bacterium]
MFKKLRLRLTLQFTILSICIYVLLGSIASAFFYAGMTDAIDAALYDIATSLEESVRHDAETIAFSKKPFEHGKLMHVHSVPSIQLWTAKRLLVEQYGPPGSPSLHEGEFEVQSGSLRMRSFGKPIISRLQIIGFIQVQLPVTARDTAISEFIEALVSTAPFLIATLAAAGYFFAARAVKPVEESYGMLRQFTADAGHELKTPVAIMRSACDNLLADLKDNPVAVERLEVINRTTERMERLVLDLLLLTKADASEPKAKEATAGTIELDMVLREILGEFSDLFEEKEMELFAEVIAPAKIVAEKDTIYKIFSNLLRNAARYSDKGSRITVSLQVDNGFAVTTVSDTGIGIPEESLNKIFDRFYRVDQSRARTAGGSGLGLAIVKALTERLGGTIHVESSVGKGSTFTVELPLA